MVWWLLLLGISKLESKWNDHFYPIGHYPFRLGQNLFLGIRRNQTDDVGLYKGSVLSRWVSMDYPFRAVILLSFS